MKKSRRRVTPKKSFNRNLLYAVFSVTLVIVASLIAYYVYFQPSTEDWTAAIVDQLAVESSFINQSKVFNASSTSILSASGFEVRYYPGEEITVDFYKDLPSKASKIFILRAHAAARNESDFIDLFTSEPYVENEYVAYGDQISRATFLVSQEEYFAVGPTFVSSSMRGEFDADSMIILMGCSTLQKDTMAKALVEKGVKVVIGWTNPTVALSEADASTLQLLEYLLVNKYNVGIAIDKINDDPSARGTMDYYPKSANSYIIPKRENNTSLEIAMLFPQVLLLAVLAPKNLNARVSPDA